MRTLFLLLLCFLSILSCKEDAPKSKLEKILASGSKDFQKIIKNKDKYEVQIMWTPISREGNHTKTEDHFFNFRPDDYFYPASTVKMPVAFLALQKLNDLQKSGLGVDLNTSLTIDSIRTPQTPVRIDTTSQTGMASIGHYINKVFAVSDNDAYNRLYEFTTQDYINSHLRTKTIFTNSRIVHRVGVGGFSYEENKWSPPITFVDEKKNVIYSRKPIMAQGSYLNPLSKTQKGVGYIDKEGNQVSEPFDFGQKNFVNILDLQESLKRIVLPDLYSKHERYDITEDARKFVLKTMAKLPKDHPYLKNNLDEYYDSYVKFFLFGDSKDPIPDHIKVHNKVGYAYGYLTDCAYIHDTKENIEYFLTATIHVNENQIYNDGVYEYDEIGIAFLAELGRVIHKYMIEEKDK